MTAIRQWILIVRQIDDALAEFEVRPTLSPSLSTIPHCLFRSVSRIQGAIKLAITWHMLRNSTINRITAVNA